jgi:hypothetical protein
MLPGVVDVTAITGQRVIGPLTSWQTPDGPYIVEQLAGMSPTSDILVFYWSPRHDWQVVNVSQITGQQIASPLTSWQTPDGPFVVEHLAGMSPTGDVLVFFWSPRHDWQVVNVSQITGQQIASPLTSWQTPDGPYNVEHLAGMSPTGDVLVFFWSPRHDWQVVNVSQITGQQIASPLTSWQTPDGPYLVEHLAGVSPGGDVLVFFWSPRHDWQVVNISQITGQQVDGPLTSWQTPDGPYLVEHLAGMSPGGDVLVFFWSPRHDWQAVNVSNITQQQIANPLTSWQTPVGSLNIEHLAGINANNDLYVFFWSPQQDWQAVNISLLTRQQIASPLTSWQTPDGSMNIEHLAGVSPGGDVLVFFWSTGGIYTVRIQAVKVADDDSTRPADIVPEQVRQWVNKANEVYAVAAIQFQFNTAAGSPDWSTINSTILNNMTGDQDQNWNQEKDTGNSVAAQHPDKITAFFRFGPGTTPTGASFSSTDYNFIAMTGFTETSVCGHQNLGLFAHELGHYMGLSHTFAREFASVQEAESFFSANGNNPAIFDGDGLSDTPPDPYVNISQVQCQATTTSLSLNGTQFILPRNNIMSYYDDPAKTITPQQVQIVRQTLEARVQRGLVLGKP